MNKTGDLVSNYFRLYFSFTSLFCRPIIYLCVTMGNRQIADVYAKYKGPTQEIYLI